MKRPTARIAALLLPLLLLSSPAQAHKLKLFAGAVGADITGYAYFSGGSGRAQDAEVVVRTPDGATVFSGRTDLQGEFRFTAARRADYLIHVDGGDGHQADFTVWARELPDNLPTAAPPTLNPGPPPSAAPPPITAPPAAVMPAPAMPADELTAQIERAVAKQVRPLREQLDAFQDQTRWRDVVGGLGWIIGLGGLAYGLSCRRKRGEKP